MGTSTEILEGIALARDDPHYVSGKVLVFPNPFSSELTVVLPSQTWHQRVQVEILDVTGKIICRDEVLFAQPSRSFPFSDLLPGIYLMRITDRTAIYHQKIIKN